MKVVITAIVATLIGAGGILLVRPVVQQASAQSKPPTLIGINSKDPFPSGCVSCHIKLPDKDVRLNVMLAKVGKHPNITSVVKVVPTDCAKCHKEGSARSLSVSSHKMHFQNPTKSEFISKFGGQCLNCHKLDAKTFKMSVKSGAKNW